MGIVLVCGSYSAKNANAVIGGAPDRLTSEVVVGFARAGSLGSPFCSGTVVDTSWILTAAHCVTDSNGFIGEWLSTSVVGTTAGLTGDSSRRSVIRGVVVHPLYRASSVGADIALVKVDPVFPTIAPIATGSDVSAIESIWGAAVAVGFGRVTQSGPTSSTALEVTTTLWPPGDCRRQWPYSGTVHRDDFICSQGSISRTVCRGDSGGPLFVTIDNRRLLAGVLSFGSANACGLAFNVHTRVSTYVSFLESYGIGKVIPVVPELPPLPTTPDGVVPDLPAPPILQAASIPVLPKFSISRAYQLVLEPTTRGCTVYIDGQVGQRGIRVRVFTQKTGGAAAASRVLDQFGDTQFTLPRSCDGVRRTGVFVQFALTGPRTQAVE